MKAFRSFACVRAALRNDHIILKPQGTGTTSSHMEIGSTKNEFYGRIDRTLCTPLFLAHCIGDQISFTALEMLCREPEHASLIPVLCAIAEAYWSYSMAHKQLTATESALFLLYATQTIIEAGESLDLMRYDHHVAFGLYCLDLATDEK